MRVLRPTPDRFDESLALLQATDRDVYGGSDWTAAELREEWDTIDLERDAWLVELEGRLAGVMHLCELRGSAFISDGYVHPELRGRGVGSMLLDLVEARARERVGEAPAASRVALHNSHLVGDAAAPLLLEAKGFVPVRTSSAWWPTSSEADPLPDWPPGVEVRPFDVAAHGRLLHAADEEAFVEEWGHTPMPYEPGRRGCFVKPQFDPSLFVVAWAGDADRGLLVQLPEAHGGLGLGRGRSASRRPGGGGVSAWRCCERASAASARRVRPLAALGVDSQNPTGATRLYERAGMRVLWRADVWEKELRPAAQVG